MKIRWLLSIGAGAGAIVSIAGAWSVLDLPRVAMASEVELTNIRQAEAAVEIYRNKLRGYLLTPEPPTPAAKQLWAEEVARTRRQVEHAERRLLDLKQ